MSVQVIERNGQPEWAVLPYDAPYLSQIEAGRRKASTKVIIALASILRVTVDDLI